MCKGRLDALALTYIHKDIDPDVMKVINLFFA